MPYYGKHNIVLLERTARYAGLLLAPAPAFLAFGQFFLGLQPRPCA